VGTDDEGDKCDGRDVVPTASRRQWATTELVRFYLGTRYIDEYEDEDGDDANEEEEAMQAHDGSTQNVKD